MQRSEVVLVLAVLILHHFERSDSMFLRRTLFGDGRNDTLPTLEFVAGSGTQESQHRADLTLGVVGLEERARMVYSIDRQWHF